MLSLVVLCCILINHVTNARITVVKSKRTKVLTLNKQILIIMSLFFVSLTPQFLFQFFLSVFMMHMFMLSQAAGIDGQLALW